MTYKAYLAVVVKYKCKLKFRITKRIENEIQFQFNFKKLQTTLKHILQKQVIVNLYIKWVQKNKIFKKLLFYKFIKLLISRFYCMYTLTQYKVNNIDNY